MYSCTDTYDVGPDGTLSTAGTTVLPDGRTETTFHPVGWDDTWGGKLGAFAFVAADLRPGDRLEYVDTFTAELPVVGRFRRSRLEVWREGRAHRVHHDGWARFWILVTSVSLTPLAVCGVVGAALLPLRRRRPPRSAAPEELIMAGRSGVG